MKAVIVNGDDFGMSAEVNSGILRAYHQGVLTSASLMVTGPMSDAAALAARENPGLDVGLHLVVCQGRSVLGGSDLDGLVDGAGRFVENPVLAGMRYFFDHRLRAALRAEVRAQIETHLRLVGYLNHIDGHLNLHAHPVLTDILVELAVEYQVPCLRVPREPVVTTLRLAPDHVVRKLTEAIIFRSLSRRMRRLMAVRGLRSTDWLFGLHQTGFQSEDYVIGAIGRLREGVTELYFHPSEASDHFRAGARQRELDILTSPRLRETFESRGVTLTTFAALARGGLGRRS